MSQDPIVARLLQNNMQIGALRPYICKKNGQMYYTNAKGVAVPTTNATLQKDEWLQFDEAVNRTSQERLVGYDALISRGLTYNLTSGMAKTMLQSQNLGDFTEAELSMNGLTRANADRPNYEDDYLPLPIVHKDFHMDARSLAASRQMGDPLDTTSAELATRVIMERKEDLLFGASTFTFGNATLHTLLTFPSRNTVTTDAGWNVSGKTGADILEDVRIMKQTMIDAHMYGPYVLFVPGTYDTILDQDYSTDYPKTIRERILEMNNIQDVLVADRLADDNIVMVQMRTSTIRLVRAVPNTTIQWDSEGGMALNFKVLSIEVPQLRADQNGNCGIVHMTVV